MVNEVEDASFFLEEIPSYLFTPVQVAYWFHEGEVPKYKLLRDPINIEELKSCNLGVVAVWRDNVCLDSLAVKRNPPNRRIVNSSCR